MTLSPCQGYYAKDVNTLVGVTLLKTTDPLWTFSEPLFSHLLKGLSMLTHGLKWHPCQVFENSGSWCLALAPQRTFSSTMGHVVVVGGATK